MRTLIATATLTVMFLSAGAFASNNRAPAVHPVNTNYTIIEKNQAWPVKGREMFDLCGEDICADV